MTTYTLSNASPGAPVLSSTVGALIPVLDFLLVTSMGWTKVYTSATTAGAVYRAPTGNRFYYQFKHEGSNDAGVEGVAAEVRVFATMTGWNTGVSATAVSSAFVSLSSENISNATARTYKFYSDGTFCHFFVGSGFSGALSWYMFGDILSFKPSDAYGSILAGATAYWNDMNTGANDFDTISAARVIVRSSTSVFGESVQLVSGNPALTGYAFGEKESPLLAHASGRFMLLPIHVNEATPAAGVRGVVPGVAVPASGATLSDGDTFVYDGKSYVVRGVDTARLCMEVSNTWRN